MTVPLILLAVCSVLVGFVGTPLWPWFQSFIEGQIPESSTAIPTQVLGVMLFSTVLVAIGIGVGWWLYGRRPVERADQPDVLEVWNPDLFRVLREKFLVDELYDATVVRFLALAARTADFLDRYVWGGIVRLVGYVVVAFSWLDRLIDEYIINSGFNRVSESFRNFARQLSRFQNGQVQRYLRLLALSLCVLAFFFLWGCKR